MSKTIIKLSPGEDYARRVARRQEELQSSLWKVPASTARNLSLSSMEMGFITMAPKKK
ncbi:MAG: hypothetical protein JJT95_15975 [Pararhodobacter sp.]|nr:hypothetical protein [Pararhodobacter sp.]